MSLVVPAAALSADCQILEVIRRAAVALGIGRPDAVYSSTGKSEQELAAVANEMGSRIAREHDWTKLTVRQDYVGDGLTNAYTLPNDYGRMPKAGRVWSSRTQQALVHVHSSDEWLQLDTRNYDTVTGVWTLIGGQMEFRPALAQGETVSWYYISRDYAVHDGVSAGVFSSDEDFWRLDCRLLELGIIWEWRSRKGLPYAEDMRTYELALAQEIATDKGARIIGQQSRGNLGAKTAYPGIITP